MVSSNSTEHEYFYLLLNIYLHTVKWLQVLLCNRNSVISDNIDLHTLQRLQELLFNTNDSIQYNSFVCTQWNGSKYCYVWQTIQLKIVICFNEFYFKQFSLT